MPKPPPKPGDPFWMELRDNQDRAHSDRRPSSRERRREDVLRAWFGDELAPLEIVARQSPEAGIRDSVEQVMGQLGMLKTLIIEDLRHQWEALVGKDVARHTQPTAVHGPRLDIEVLEPAWLYILEGMHKKAIRERVAEATEGKLTEIRFVPVGRRPLAAPRRPPPRVPPRP